MPVDLVEMKIVDTETGDTCPPGVPGEIAIRGPNVMLGYWNRPEETARAVRDGWFYSGDIGQTDGSGYFYIVDRLKDMIVVGALKVFPAEVERVMLDHPMVAEVAVVGFPDELLGEKVVAFVVTTQHAAGDAASIRGYCDEHLAAYKIPQRIVFVDGLPRNPAGKVLKTRLRESELPEREPGLAEIEGSLERLTGRATTDTAMREPIALDGPLIDRMRSVHRTGRRRYLAEFLRGELGAVTGRSDLPEDDRPISEAEIDSLTIVELRDRIQQQLGARFEVTGDVRV